MSAWRLAVAGLIILAGFRAVAGSRSADATPATRVLSERAGESIYLRGVLPSGTPLAGSRESGGISTQGRDAACVNCHQRSGLGSKEGDLFIPAITGEYLFHERAHSGTDPLLHYVEGMHGNRAPYSPVSLARAIREGLDSDGRRLSYLMPRYALNDSDMAALIAYLKQLSVHQSPGITGGVLHFATIFTPDSDAVKRAGVVDVLQHYVIEKNSFPFGPTPKMWTSGKTAFAKSMYMANLRWQLHVWQLTGPAATWRAQLDKHLHDEPVFAVLSGLGGSNWAPVHEFCEQNGVPCLFPNVEVPVVEEGGFYSLYFSKGVLLEAELISDHIAGQDKGSGARVDQVYRRGDSGEPAAQALAVALKARGITVRDHALAPGTAGRGLAAALRAAGDTRFLVLWLRPADIAALGAPPARARFYMSGLMSGLEDTPLPGSWRDRTFLAYPFDVPDRRGVRLDYPLGWFTFRHIPIVARQVQVDTYLACSVVSEVLRKLADSYVRAYFIEQLQQELEHRLVTGYYPHLALSYHERFASKGGYIAHFAPAASGSHLVADGDWTVP
jgi:mono/diheme cytochrome c family protein